MIERCNKVVITDKCQGYKHVHRLKTEENLKIEYNLYYLRRNVFFRKILYQDELENQLILAATLQNLVSAFLVKDVSTVTKHLQLKHAS